jgi:hypothetical protein
MVSYCRGMLLRCELRAANCDDVEIRCNDTVDLDTRCTDYMYV